MSLMIGFSLHLQDKTVCKNNFKKKNNNVSKRGKVSDSDAVGGKTAI